MTNYDSRHSCVKQCETTLNNPIAFTFTRACICLTDLARNHWDSWTLPQTRACSAPRHSPCKQTSLLLAITAVFSVFTESGRTSVPSPTPSPDCKLSVGPIWRPRPVAYTRAMSEHRCFPKKRLTTHTMHFKWHHRNLSKNDHESLKKNHEWRHAFIINAKRKVTIPVYKVDMDNDRQLVQL